jgi:N6-L-threonylcarbamoyladenine synthase
LVASFQKAVVDALVSRAMKLVTEEKLDKLAVAGGVASNSALRKALGEACAERNVKFYSPSPGLCTDNAVMIGAAGYYEYISGTRHGYDLNAVPNLKLGER